MAETTFSVHKPPYAPLPCRTSRHCSGRGVLEHYDLVLQILDLDARIGVRELAAARQLDEQEHAAALDQQLAAADDLLALAHCLPGGAVDRVPELFDIGMGGAPIELELLYFLVGEPIRLKLAPGVEPALIAERKIAGFADFPLR